MSEELKCEIVRDLMPSYIDGLTSEITNEAVREHIDGCQECAALYKKMNEPEQTNQSFAAEVNYMKKVKNLTRIKILATALTAVILVAGIFFWRVFICGFSVSPSSVDYNVLLEENTVTFRGRLLGSGNGYSHVQFNEDDGVVTATVYTVPASAFRHSDSFTETYTANGKIKAVYFDDLIAYENGNISRSVAEAFKTKTAYVGDISADNRVAVTLGIRNKIGAYLNELQTSLQPYGWTLIFSDIIPSSEEAAVNKKMMDYSYVMISLVDNLGYVSWEYKTDHGIQTLTISQEDASAFIGKDIKSCSDSVIELQSLMNKLDMD